MTTKIEEIMVMGLRKHKLGRMVDKVDCDKGSASWKMAIADMRAILTALDAAGLKVVSIHASAEQPPRIGARLICGTCERPFDPEEIDQTVCQACMESGLGAGPAE